MNWKGNRLWIFGVALVVLGTGVFFAWRSREKEDDGSSGGAPTATLPHVSRDQIDTVEISRPHEEPVRLTKGEHGWRLATPVQAKADQNAVNAILDKLSALESTGVAASNRANHARLEVDHEHGVRVVVKHGTTVLIDFWIGAYRSGTTMVRLEGQDHVVTVDGALRYLFAKEVKDWRDRAIVDVAPEHVTDVTFQNEHGTFHFTRGADWALAAGQAPIERFAPAKVQSLVLSLAHLRATDFADGATPETTGLGQPDQATVTAQLSASDAGPAEQVVVHVGKPHGEGSTDRYAQREGDPTIYVVSGYVADRLRTNVDGFQESPDAGAPAAPPPGAGGPEGMPQLQMGGGGPGGQQIPPELMRQIQQQLQQRGGGQ